MYTTTDAITARWDSSCTAAPYGGPAVQLPDQRKTRTVVHHSPLRTNVEPGDYSLLLSNPRSAVYRTELDDASDCYHIRRGGAIIPAKATVFCSPQSLEKWRPPMKPYLLPLMILALEPTLLPCSAAEPIGESATVPEKATPGRQVFGNGDVLIRELDKAVNRELIQTDPSQTNLWKAVSYVSEEFAGVMLGEGGGPNQKPVTIRLGAKGVYRVFLGLYAGYNARQMRVRLSGAESSDTIPIKATGNRTLVISETFWKQVDLTGKDLVLEGSGDANLPGALAYVRLQKVSERKDSYPMVISEDGYGIFLGSEHSGPEDLEKPFASIPEGTCMKMLLWGNGCADNCNYPTKVGQFYPNAGYQLAWRPEFARNIKKWQENGWDSLQVMREYTRKRKWEFHVYIRMEAFKAPFPFDAQENSKFFNDHPEYHCLDRQGQKVNRLSYAYPEVQRYVLSLIEEIAGYEPDGVCLCFIRGLPLVLYESIMVDGFKKRYGVDPRELDELDPRWMDYQGTVVTSFIRAAKRTLKPNQRLSVIVPATELDCRRWGLDVATWVKEGLVDDLLPTGQIFDAQDIHRDDPDNLDFDYFARLEGRANIRLIPLLYPWTKFSADFDGWERLMHSFLDRGADAYAVWDGRSSISKTKDLGKTLNKYERPAPPPVREIKLKSLHGFRIDRYHYFEVI